MDSAAGDVTPPSGTLPPVWVISLTRATDRRRSIDEHFRALGQPYEIVDAVDGRTADVAAQYAPWRTRFRIGRTMAAGDIACSLSHLHAYRRMVEDDVPVAMILEDDVQPTAAFPDILAAVGSLPPDWEVVTLHSLFPAAGPRPLPGPPLADGYRVCTYARMPYGTQCYLVRRSAAERLLAAGLPVTMPADELLFRRHPVGLRYYGIEPSPVRHATFGSELGGRPPDDARGLTRIAARAVVLAGKGWARLRRMRQR